MENRTDMLGAVLQTMEARRHEKIEEIRGQVTTASTPLSQELVERISQLNPRDVREILMEHPGYPSWEALGSYNICINVFHKAFDDLSSAISRFEVLAREGKFFGRSNEDVSREVEITVQKELLSATNAAHSLQDHSTRRLQKRIGVSGYREQLEKEFSDDGLHEFIVGLRRIIHHLRMQPANWSVTKDGRADPEVQAEFQLEKKELLLLSHELNTIARRYLERTTERINVRAMFEEYRRRVTAFHGWLSNTIETAPLHDLQDYERCLSENKKYGSRTVWKAMIGNWLNSDNPPNPYDYLD